MTSLPQYYRLLSISSNATPDEVRQAYKKESLRTHPDRLPAGSTAAQRKSATEKFQAVADAYYVLSDPARRREYDALVRQHGGARSGGGFGGSSSGSRARSKPAPSANAGGSSGYPGGFPSASDFFGGSSGGSAPHADTDDPEDEDLPYDPSEQPAFSSAFFSNFGDFMRNATAGGSGAPTGEKKPKEEEEDEEEMFGSEKSRRKSGGRPDAERTFGNVFEEMLAPEVAHVRPWWSYMGGASGAVMGYIVANVPGAVAGAVAGNRLGAIRDAKGKSVAQVFNGLGSSQKAEILRGLAFKVLGSMT